jgi:hypothetical protein
MNIPISIVSVLVLVLSGIVMISTAHIIHYDEELDCMSVESCLGKFLRKKRQSSELAQEQEK